MTRTLLAGALLIALAGCDDSMAVTGCGPGALCTRPPVILATGTVKASVNPIPGALVMLTAYRDSCGGTPAALYPSPAVDTTDSRGRFSIGVIPQDTAASACLRVSYSSALFADTSGIVLDPGSLTTDTLRVNLVGP